jgi:hypothetical protein
LAGTAKELEPRNRPTLNADARLVAVKALHTAIWVFLAVCALAIPVAAWLEEFALSLALIAIVGAETLVLAMNAWRCPLQAVAARYTSDRSGNFDIYLPAWLASRTMIIFGPLFVFGIAVTAVLWVASRSVR